MIFWGSLCKVCPAMEGEEAVVGKWEASRNQAVTKMLEEEEVHWYAPGTQQGQEEASNLPKAMHTASLKNKAIFSEQPLAILATLQESTTGRFWPTTELKMNSK